MSESGNNRRRSSRRGGGRSFRPKKGVQNLSKKQEKEAVDARAEIVGDKPSEEFIFASEDKHLREIERAEDKAAGVAPEKRERRSRNRGRGRGKGKGTRQENQEEEKPKHDPVPVPDPEPKGIVNKVKASANKVIKKVKEIIKPDTRPHKEVIINSESLETRVALLEEGVLEDFAIERTNEERIVGSIFKGKIKNLEDGLKAAFVDIGYEKNAFLHYWDIIPSNLDSGVEVVDRGKSRKGKRERPKITQKDIPTVYPPGSEIIVQVTKGPIGTKGPRITTHLAIPGRYLVLLPYADMSGVSRKIENNVERGRLKNIVRELNIPDGMGVIVRTAGEGQQKRYFIRDLALLVEEWKQIQHKIDTQKPATCVFREPDLVERTVRDFLTEDIKRVVVDNAPDFERITDLIGKISKRSLDKLKLYQESTSIFDRFGIARQLESTFARKVNLRSGGYLMIDETEALVTIDVNTGSHKNQNDQDSTIFRVNQEAADEICRQLRLRNMGGLIVLDFIDMRSRRDQNSIYQQMKRLLKKDKAKTHTLPISPLGLMEMTRQRHSESVRDAVYQNCHYCKGRGKVKSPLTMSVEIQRKLQEILKKRQRDTTDFQLKIVVNERVLERLRKEDEQLMIEMEKKFYGKLSFRSDPEFHTEQFSIVNALTNEELAASSQ